MLINPSVLIKPQNNESKHPTTIADIIELDGLDLSHIPFMLCLNKIVP